MNKYIQIPLLVFVFFSTSAFVNPMNYKGDDYRNQMIKNGVYKSASDIANVDAFVRLSSATNRTIMQKSLNNHCNDSDTSYPSKQSIINNAIKSFCRTGQISQNTCNNIDEVCNYVIVEKKYNEYLAQ
jgi:hypothetical protein